MPTAAEQRQVVPAAVACQHPHTAEQHSMLLGGAERRGSSANLCERCDIRNASVDKLPANAHVLICDPFTGAVLIGTRSDTAVSWLWGSDSRAESAVQTLRSWLRSVHRPLHSLPPGRSRRCPALHAAPQLSASDRS